MKPTGNSYNQALRFLELRLRKIFQKNEEGKMHNVPRFTK